MAVLPVNYMDATTPTGALTELPATTGRGLNAITAQINANTTAISGLGSGSSTVLDLTLPPYNADPTGVTDIAPIVLTALDDTHGLKQLYLPEGTYKWNSSVSSGYTTTLLGAGVGRTIINHTPTVTMLQIVGPSLTTYTLSANIAAGANTITLTSASGIGAGDVLNIRSLKMWPGSETTTGSGKNARYGELVEVASVAGSVVTLTGLIAWDYATTDTVVVDRLAMINGVHIEGMTIKNAAPNTGGNSIFTMRRIRNATFRDLEFQYQDSTGVEGYMVWGLSADNITFRDGSEQGGSGRLAYGFDMRDACRDWTIFGCKMFGGRHLFTCNSYGVTGTLCFGIPRGAVITGCLAANCYEAPFDTHEEGDDITLVGCKVLSSKAFAFQVRAPRTKLIGCSSSGMQAGVMIRKSATNFEIKHYTALDVKTGGAGYPAGVQIDDNGPVGGTIDGVEVDGSDHAAVLVGTGSASVVIRNVTARDVARTAGNGAVEFVGTSSNHTVQNIVTYSTSDPAVYGPSTVTGVAGDGIRPHGGGAISGGGMALSTAAANAVSYVVVSTGSEPRPSTTGPVLWIGGSTQPTNYSSSIDIWFGV